MLGKRSGRLVVEDTNVIRNSQVIVDFQHICQSLPLCAPGRRLCHLRRAAFILLDEGWRLHKVPVFVQSISILYASLRVNELGVDFGDVVATGVDGDS
jgi:hypothetical protein